VQRVHDMDELATALIMFAQPHPVRAGGLVSLHDSGGDRQLLIDLAHDAGVPLTTLPAATTERLTALLDPDCRRSTRSMRGVPAGRTTMSAWNSASPRY